MLNVFKIERISRDITISHFLLMFGYKLFSLYFPLFLAEKGFSLPQIGYTYLLIYLSIAVFSPLLGYLNNRFNSFILLSFGITGYALYSLAMIFPLNTYVFFLMQIMLGISAALFYVSSRVILNNNYLESKSKSFGWYYTAPTYAAAIAPIIGAFILLKFGFGGIFALSLGIHFINIVFSFKNFKRYDVKTEKLSIGDFNQTYKNSLEKIKDKSVFPFALLSFFVLLLSGVYSAFFVLFLKEELGWSQDVVLLFVSISSVLFLLLSLFAINLASKQKTGKNILEGGIVAGAFSVVIGCFSSFLNFITMLFIDSFRSLGRFMVNTGRSSLISSQLKDYPKAAGSIDTIFSPLGVALGSLLGGFLIEFLGYRQLFFFGGIIVLLVCIFVFKKTKAN